MQFSVGATSGQCQPVCDAVGECEFRVSVYRLDAGRKPRRNRRQSRRLDERSAFGDRCLCAAARTHHHPDQSGRIAVQRRWRRGADGPANPQSEPGDAHHCRRTTQAGTTGTQYVFTGWSDGGAASHSITVGASAATYTASFKTQYQLTISASPVAGGTVTPASGAFYDSGTVVNIQATANTGTRSRTGRAASRAHRALRPR